MKSKDPPSDGTKEEQVYCVLVGKKPKRFNVSEPFEGSDQVCLSLPLLLHLPEGLGPPVVAAERDLLHLLPLLFLLHYVRVDAPATALPLAQVLRREKNQPGSPPASFSPRTKEDVVT